MSVNLCHLDPPAIKETSSLVRRDEIDALLTLRERIAQELRETEALLSARLDAILADKQRQRGDVTFNDGLHGNGVIDNVSASVGLGLEFFPGQNKNEGG